MTLFARCCDLSWIGGVVVGAWLCAFLFVALADAGHSSVWRHGFDAARRGMPESSNPYIGGTATQEEWQREWEKGFVEGSRS